MRPIARALIRLYPPAWRQRYGEEFAALLEDSPPAASILCDLLKGAIKMQLNTPAFPKLAVMLSMAGLLAGLGVSFLMTPVYVSTAEMRYQPVKTADSPRSLVEYLMQNENQVESRTSLSNIIQDPFLSLYKSEVAHIPLEDIVQKMRQNITIRIDSKKTTDSLAFSIQFAYPDRDKAQRTVQMLITRFSDANLALQRASASTARAESDRTEQRLSAIEKRLGMDAPPPPANTAGINLDVLDPPSLPLKPVAPKRAFFMLIGFGVGFGSAVVVAISRRRPPLVPLPAQTA